VCDEPVFALDVSIKPRCEPAQGLQNEFPLARICSSPMIFRFVEHISDRVAVDGFGKIVELAAGLSRLCTATPSIRIPKRYCRADTQELAAPAHARIVLPAYVHNPADPPPGCEFHTAAPLRAATSATGAASRCGSSATAMFAACQFADELALSRGVVGSYQL